MTSEEKMILKLLRISKGIKLKELSEYIGCSGNMVTMHETNKGNFSPDKLERYREYIENYKSLKV